MRGQSSGQDRIAKRLKDITQKARFVDQLRVQRGTYSFNKKQLIDIGANILKRKSS
jgi:hypothetical protein